jgi:hypothetical protein
MLLLRCLGTVRELSCIVGHDVEVGDGCSLFGQQGAEKGRMEHCSANNNNNNNNNNLVEVNGANAP